MPWCPSCGDEFRPGIDECPDCGLQLTAERSPPPGHREPHVRLPETLSPDDDPVELTRVSANLAELLVRRRRGRVTDP